MSERKEIKPDILMAQYREAYAHFLHNSRFMWQVYSLAVIISGGLIIASFASIEGKDLWWARDLILLISLVISLPLLIHVKKHRYFTEIVAATLSQLEDTLGTKRIQRTTRIEWDALREDNSKPKTEDYWNELKPEDKERKLKELLDKKPADKWHKRLGYSILILLAKIDCKLEVFFAKRSADKWLGYSMYALLVIIIACIVINTIMGLIH